jgi:hypothetical protein
VPESQFLLDPALVRVNRLAADAKSARDARNSASRSATGTAVAFFGEIT